MKAKEITDEFVTEMAENVTHPPASFYAVEDLIWDWLMYTVREDDRCNNIYDVCSLFLKEYPEW